MFPSLKMISGSNSWSKRLLIYKNLFCDDCLKKKVYDKIYKVLLVLLSLLKCHVSLSHISEEGKNLLEYDSWEKSLKCHFFMYLVIMPCSYSEIKDVAQAIFSLFGLVTATFFNFLS